MNNGNSKRGGAGRGGNDKRKSTPGGNDRNRKPAGASGKSFSQEKKEGGGYPKPKPFVKKAAEKKAAPKTPSNPNELRLNKYIANSGMCSRRDADIYIQSGNVKVNGQVVTELGYKVLLSDKVEFDGTTIMPEPKEYLLLNKPKNFATLGDVENDLRNVTELIRGASKAKLQPIGRMDRNTTGLLIFTNDADMVRKFSQPNQKSFKIYQVSLDKNLKFEDLEKISNGVTLDGHKLFIDEISYVENEPKTEIGLKLRTPNVKVVRAIFEQFGYDVLKVDRVAFAGLTKKKPAAGQLPIFNRAGGN
jgi:23S rRNA pseudouridine2605 synthase